MNQTRSERGAVLISGASTGIGEATALALARDGFIVYAGIRNDADAQRLAAAHPHIRPLQLDVTVPEQIADALARIGRDGIALRGVVCNAGIAVAGPLEYLPLDDIRRQYEINVFGALALVQAALAALRATKGRIVLVGSIAGRFAVPFVGAYSSSKAALAAMADALRVELAPFGVGVSLIEPGNVKTPIWQKGRDARAGLEARMPAAAREHYGPAIGALSARSEHEERTGLPPDVVARAIEHALVARAPRAKYVLGTPAHIQALLAHFPANVRDRAIKAALGIP